MALIEVTLEKLLSRMHNDMWRVAAHYEYHKDGVLWHYWLFTHPHNMYVQGNATSDIEAIMQCLKDVNNV